MFIDHMTSAATRGTSGNAVTGAGDNAYPVDGADEQWSDARDVIQRRSPVRSSLVGAT